MLLAAVGSLYVSSAVAGPLATDPNAYTRNDPPQFELPQTFHGTSFFGLPSGPAPLEGYIDWAVYGPGVLPAGYVGMSVDPGDWLYAFQFHNTGTTPVAQITLLTITFAAGNSASVNDVGTFTADGIQGRTPSEFGTPDDPFTYFEPGDYPHWSFSDPILPGESTTGLAYSSDHWPTFDTSVFAAPISSGYLNDNVEPFNYSYFFEPKSGASHLPIPETPEPSSFVLAALGLIGWVVWLRRKRS